MTEEEITHPLGLRLLVLGGVRRSQSQVPVADWIRLLGVLTGMQAAPFVLRFVHGLSLERIAELLGHEQSRRRSTIHMRLAKALDELREPHNAHLLEALAPTRTWADGLGARHRMGIAGVMYRKLGDYGGCHDDV
jgi:hypothetical protein